MKICICDVTEIVDDLNFLKKAYGKGLTELKLLDFAICEALEKDKPVAAVLYELKTGLLKGDILVFLNKLALIDVRDRVLSDDEITKIYKDLRCISAVRFWNGRTFYIGEVGFSQELCEVLNSTEYTNTMYNIYNNLTDEKLHEITNNNVTLMEEFNNKMRELGFTWRRENSEKVILDYEYSYSNMRDNPHGDNYIVKSKYVEMAERLLESRNNNKQLSSKLEAQNKKVTQKIQYNPVLEKPFASQAFKALPAEFQEWMKKGFVQEISQQMPKFKTDRTGRIISQMVENKEKSNDKFVEVKTKKSRKTSVKQQDVLELIKDDLTMIYDLDDEFIIKNQEDIWDCIILGDGNAKTKRELLRHIDNICNQKQVLN